MARWRIVDFCEWIYEEFRVAVSKQTLTGACAHGISQPSARPRHHARAKGAIENVKKFPARLSEIALKQASASPRKKSGSQTRRAAAKRTKCAALGPAGTRPRLRMTSDRLDLYFRRDLSQEGKGAASSAPLQQKAMDLHLQAIRKAVAPGKHAIVLLEQAGWRMADKLAAPANIISLAAQMPRTQPDRECLAVDAG